LGNGARYIFIPFFSEDTLLVNIERVDIAFHTRRGEARANTSAGEAKGGEAKRK